MSRSKKSRKPGGAPTAKPKLSKQELEKVEKRVRKKTGKVAGNRQKEAAQTNTDNNAQNVKKDPRLGNKTPIALGKLITKSEKPKVNKPKQTQIAAVRFAEDTEEKLPATQNLSPEDELNAIEEDEALQSILAKQEDDIALTEQEVNYYNELMERHQVLSAELGLDEEDTDIDEEKQSDSEDDLWNKLDGHDFSDFTSEDEDKEL